MTNVHRRSKENKLVEETAFQDVVIDIFDPVKVVP